MAAAVAAAGSVAAVLTFSTNELSGRAQEVVGGVLSVLAVGLVTAMIFWMRRIGRTLSVQLRGDVVRAAAIGAGALTLTAFLAVAREGVETSLFLWTAVKASGSTPAPLVGAGVGLVAAVLVCWLLCRQAVRINLGKFFTRTAYALIVITAGVLAYGLGDLQSAGWLPGRNWVAFDLTGQIDPSSWWISILTGVTELSPRMSVLQVVAWCSYLAVVIGAFAIAGRPALATSPAAQTASSAAVQTAPSAATAALTAAPAEGPARPGSTTEPVPASGPPDSERVGASYNSFGDGGVAVDGLSDGLAKGADDPDFTGLHRLEYGLWSGQSAAELLPVVDQLAADVTTVRAKLATDDEAGDPTNLPLRAHEILEDALRDHLSGIDNNGADAAYAMTYANTQVTALVLDTLAPLITVRAPTLLPSISRELSALQTALLATKVGSAWTQGAQVPLPARQRVNAAIGAVLESLASVPDLLEVPPSHQ